MKENLCNICPRGCGVDRKCDAGFCGAPDDIYVSRIALHAWEEPPISGKHGSGTVFFTGCNLRCVFCQNRTINGSGAFNAAQKISVASLAESFIKLQENGAHNINLVTPTHYAKGIAEALRLAKPRLSIPVVYNTSSYESDETLARLDGLVDIYLPDIKYFSSELSKKYSSAPDYFDVASRAVKTMFDQVGEAKFSTDGMMTRGMIVRHLVLPGCRRDSMEILRRLSEILPVDKIKLSLMRQFTPDFVDCEKFPELCRRVTTFEYNSVLECAEHLGFDGYIQAADSALSAYTPDFNTPEAFSFGF